MKTGHKKQSVQQTDQTNAINSAFPQPGSEPEGHMPPQAATDRISASDKNPASPPQKSHKAPKTISNVIGEIVWLMARSVNHRYLFISDMEWMVMQPVALAQYRLFYSENHPIGVALWANVNEKVEDRLKQGISRMSPQDWNSGDRIWLIDLIAPFGNISAMLDDLKKNVFKDKIFQYTQRDEKGQLVTRSSKDKYSVSVDRPSSQPHTLDGHDKE